MKLIFHLLCAAFLCLLLPSQITAQITTPYLYHSNTNNWSATGISAVYRGSLGTKNHRFTFQATFSGSNFYKINNQPTNTDMDFNLPGGSKVWSGGLSLNTQGTAFAYGDGQGGAGSFNITSGKYYSYNWEDVNTSSNANAIVLETDNSPVSIVAVSAMPANPISTDVVTVSVNLSATPSAQENIYLRYSTNGFSTYGTLLTAATGSGTSTQTFTIPAQAATTAVSYYAFSTTLASGALSGNAFLTDLATLFFNNNGGANYSYTVLPIELTAFKASVKNQQVELQWNTAMEIENDHFDIERSTDSRTWKAVTTVPGNGTTYTPQQYVWTDAKPASGVNYYRLRQVDMDGKSALSPVVKATLGSQSSASVFPNPVAGNTLSVSFAQADEQAVQVRLRDAQGRLLRTWDLENTETTQSLDISGIAAGVLFLQVHEETPIKIVKNE